MHHQVAVAEDVAAPAVAVAVAVAVASALFVFSPLLLTAELEAVIA